MDIEHFYIEKGQGFPLILLHGNTSKNAGHRRNQRHDQRRAYKADCGKHPRCQTRIHQGQSLYCKQMLRGI